MIDDRLIFEQTDLTAAKQSAQLTIYPVLDIMM